MTATGHLRRIEEEGGKSAAPPIASVCGKSRIDVVGGAAALSPSAQALFDHFAAPV
jgi:hypothetical protein